MAPIAARQSELGGESREITIHRTPCAYILYIYVRVWVHACVGLCVVCLCASTLYGDTDDDG